MKNFIYLLISICSYNFFSYKNPEPSNCIKDTILHLDTIICNNQKSVIEISSDSSYNLFIKIYDSGSNNPKYLQSINGCGNCELVDTPFVKKIQLSRKSLCSEYVLNVSVKGSTYGAVYLFIIWNNGTEWEITRMPIHRYEIKDINKDGVYEIIDFTINENGIPYYFENGSLFKYLSR